jgi:hypothetical protein
MTPKRVRILAAVAVVFLAAATTRVLSRPGFPEDTTRCKNYVCRVACEDTVYVIGVCRDGNQYSQITIECCCCVPGSNNRTWTGG